MQAAQPKNDRAFVFLYNIETFSKRYNSPDQQKNQEYGQNYKICHYVHNISQFEPGFQLNSISTKFACTSLIFCDRTLLIANNANERMTPIFYKDFKKVFDKFAYSRHSR